MALWFAYDANGDFSTHDTADKAKAAAKAALELESDYAGDDGWRDEVEWICWGEIHGCVVLASSTPCEPGERFDSIDEYELRDVLPRPAPTLGRPL